jgi:hypothetical protein
MLPMKGYNTSVEYLGKQQLVLPKEITGGLRDVLRFHAAGSFGNHETDYNAILIMFETISKNAQGFDQRNMVSVKVSRLSKNKLLVSNLCSGDTTEIALK